MKPLGRRAAQTQEQLWRDEALARKLQEEEWSRLRAQRSQEQREDYRAAQVAQDEEIAHYIQGQEMKAHWRKPSQESVALSSKGPHHFTQPMQRGPSGGCSQEKAQQSQRGQLMSAGATAIWVQPLERLEGPTPEGHTVGCRGWPLCRNIAEDLDPTFRAKALDCLPSEASALCPQASSAAAPSSPLPVDRFFNCLEATAALPFVSPTKRHPENVGQQKSREKREGCKQQ
ncbi:uncharacterized protein LOC121936360 isoform X2 [Sceloporus undulatus]|nr:uncharacterized protein LOC121936360 isoform X2 [Sceloporus undulatus]